MTDPIRPSLPTLPPLGDIETQIAAAALELEDSSERSREAAREARRLRRESQRDRIDHLRGAARGNLVIGLIEPAVDTVVAAASLAETNGAHAQYEATPPAKRGDPPSFGATFDDNSERVDGAVGGVQAIGRFFTQRAERRAEVDGNVAGEHGDRASSFDDAAAATDRLAERAFGHLDAVSRARWQARLELARG